MNLSKARVDVLVWVLIYIGMLLVGLGIAVERRDDALGWSVLCVGAALAGLGVLMIWLRSRMKDER